MEMNLIKPTINFGYARNALESAYPNLWNGKVGHWVPALGPQGDKLYDVSGYGNHGDLTNMTNDDWVPGRNGYALDFDGVNDYVNVPPSSSLNSDFPEMTVAAWVKSDDLSFHHNRFFYMQAQSPLTLSTQMGIATSGMIFLHTAIGGVQYNNDINDAGEISVGLWYHLVFTWNGSTWDYYRNGVYRSSGASHSGSITTSGTNESNEIGYVSISSSQGLVGQMDDIRTYNRALSASEIMQLYRDPFADLRLRDFAFGHAQAAAGGGLSIPVAMKSYRTRRAA